MDATESKVLWFFIAVLVSVISALVTGYLAYDGSARRAVLCGLAAFGGTLVAVTTIEASLGV